MGEREPFKPTIRKEEFLDEEKYIIGVEHYNQTIFLPGLTINEIVHLRQALDDFLFDTLRKKKNI